MPSLEDPALLKELNARVSGPKTGRALKKECTVWGIPDLVITRWKFNEWDYYSPKAQLPIEARGLFTLGNRIVIRSYNKFFNTGEVRATKPARLRDETRGPYYATVKENGYLVLIGAHDGKLVVTSKNSSGPDSTNDAGRNYSEVARNWVFRHLAAAGRTEEEFARFLEENNWTAAGEVCDDSFEEHVLPYPPEIAGIYLNGLNHNTRAFTTEPPARVLEAAERFGFRRTEFVEFESFEALMAFLEEGAATGKWRGREVEGFVIRCKRVCNAKSAHSDEATGAKAADVKAAAAKAGAEAKDAETADAKAADANTADAKATDATAADTDDCAEPAGADERVEDFFWKFKFEEPYLMYREWREVVKKYLWRGNAEAQARARRSRHAASCLRFLPFARVYLRDHPELRTQLTEHNLGIIELRSRFLENPDVNEEALLALDATRPPRWLLVTVATLGCGKSTVGGALRQLLGADVVGHVQNDALGAPGKSGKMARFVAAIGGALAESPAVIVDKNHSGRDERAKLFDSCDELAATADFDAKYVCLNFLPGGPTAQTAQLTRARVAARGDNHATVKAGQLGAKALNGIMVGFERRFDCVTPQASPDDRFDLVIDLEPGESAENVRRVLDALRARYADSPLAPREFSAAEIAAAVQAARDAEAAQGAAAAAAPPKPKAKDKKKCSYFGVVVSPPDRDALVARAKELLGANSALRVRPELHVTLAHVRSHPQAFEALRTQHAEQLKQRGCGALGERRDLAVLGLAWNERVAAFKVQIDGCANAQAHMTVATAAGAAAVESNGLFEDGSAARYVAFDEPVLLKDQELHASR